MERRVIILVLDSVGIGSLPDAEKYGDLGCNTLSHVIAANKGLKLPNLTKLGLAKISGVEGLDKTVHTMGSYGRLAERSAGKDTTTGHWEMAGIVLERAFPTYPSGFPQKIIEEFIEKTDCKGILCNMPASGTAILEELGDDHVKTGYPIVYTSADSVFQIAAHEKVIPLKKLYEYCEAARGILQGEHAVGRVIARPFIGESGKYTRTGNRKDFSLTPTGKTVLDLVKESGGEVCAVGKIEDIFAGSGITSVKHNAGNMACIRDTLAFMDSCKKGLIFTNLVDFDMSYGHRNDAVGYGKALEYFDERLPEIMGKMRDDDLLIITADHGCDPTTKGTDHTREYVPALVYGKKFSVDKSFGTAESFTAIAATVANWLELKHDFGDGLI